jgi:AraC-like DNA-binding protein
MDVLSDVLDTLALRGTLYFRTRSTPPWGLRVPAYPGVARFHLVARGRCHLAFEDGSRLWLETGDLVVIPRGAPHVIADHPATRALALDDVVQRSGYDGEGVLVFGGDGDPSAQTELICGHFSFEQGADHPLLRALPDHLRVCSALRQQHLWLDQTMSLLTRLMFSSSPGIRASVIRLSEVLFVEMVRAYTDRDPALGRVLAAMFDRRIGKALQLIHRHPERPWTVERLGRAVAMSRSRFAERFQAQLDCTPMHYLTQWRLQKARRLLASGASVQQVAAQVGYASSATFSRAFTRHFGHSPRALRGRSAQ